MEKAFVELLVLGQVPGTDTQIGYQTSIGIASGLIILLVAYSTLRYRVFVARKLKLLSPDKLIELKSI